MLTFLVSLLHVRISYASLARDSKLFPAIKLGFRGLLNIDVVCVRDVVYSLHSSLYNASLMKMSLGIHITYIGLLKYMA